VGVINRASWIGRSVFVTGHTGFVGSWLCLYLNGLGAKVSGFSLAPPTKTSLFDETRISTLLERHFEADIRDSSALANAIDESKPEVVVHLAAQSLVLRSYDEPKLTWEANVVGTINLLESVLTRPSVRVIQIFTSDKCYDNTEQDRPFQETDALGGRDPYSASKAACELAVAAWRHAFFSNKTNISLSTIRAGNIIGGGDWAADRLIPDCVRALERRESIQVRNPDAVRPWQHVLDALTGMLILAEAQFREPQKHSQAFNIGPQPSPVLTVAQVLDLANKCWFGQEHSPRSTVGPASTREAQRLRLDVTKAMSMLDWKPRRSTPEAVKETMEWYRSRFQLGTEFDARSTCQQAIAAEINQSNQ